MQYRILIVACAVALGACATEPYAERDLAAQAATTEDRQVVTHALPDPIDGDVDRQTDAPFYQDAEDATDYFRNTLETRVQLALQQSGLDEVIVLVDAEEVHLSGYVETLADKDRARKVAADVPGVDRVHSDALDIA